MQLPKSIALTILFFCPIQSPAQLTNNSADSLRDYNLRLQSYQVSLDEHKLHLEEHALSERSFYLTIAGIIGSAIALAFGFVQYRKAELWKRAEFLAKEMKTFFDDRSVQNVLAMIDWGSRYVEFVPNADPGSEDYPKVSRGIQVSALQPHVFLTLDGNSDAEGVAAQDVPAAIGDLLAESVQKTKFNRVELHIRDCYDRFLDFLERFGSYLESNLVDVRELDPYLRYWVTDVVSYTKHPDEAAWTCAVLAYIEFYGFQSVQYLFLRYGFNISVDGELFNTQAAMAADQTWVLRLQQACHSVGCK